MVRGNNLFIESVGDIGILWVHRIFYWIVLIPGLILFFFYNAQGMAVLTFGEGIINLFN